ncbi:hypothetical protein [Streptomyces sp. NPDC058305]|uniref:hypothetical protein n=1 Tax=Streptomyces sp. NPDC058305 TaxID=3346438 RepID=UPI0036E0B7B0
MSSPSAALSLVVQRSAGSPRSAKLAPANARVNRGGRANTSTSSFLGSMASFGNGHRASCSSGETSAEGASKYISHSTVVLSGSMK